MEKSCNRTAKGFTLIELVIVIVILGILSAFAIPRYLALVQQARNASTLGLYGAILSASAIVHSGWLAQGGIGTNVAMENGNVTTTIQGYPVGDDQNSLTGIVAALNTFPSGFSVNGSNPSGPTVFTLIGTTNCTVTYDLVGGVPTITTTAAYYPNNTTGCN
jgi:MSHA pilin protein MshA